ncbi:c-Myc-binding protein-like isoform X1 [Anguilla anguilla]|uniref:c-Myc-binding protein-like isoform X1 n=1 Tax=Anguilla anguilla TaxID=7936 RepID=UPI0015B0A9F9|nr:c-Myc-binding protein-like isoform X1 [Anguilla anguilla]
MTEPPSRVVGRVSEANDNELKFSLHRKARLVRVVFTASGFYHKQQASESRREQFRRYLEKAGVLDSLTSVLVALYEENDKPINASDASFLKRHLGLSGPAPAEAEKLRSEMMEVQQQYERLLEENRGLKNRLLQYEPAQEGATL